MKIISKSKRSCVYYNSNNDSFFKTFSPSFRSRLKFLFHLRKYPGENFYFISKILNKLNIKTPVILNYSKYSITMSNIKGISLDIYSQENPEILKKYIDIIVKILSNNIYSGDLSLDNFIVYKNEIYVIDMEDYRYSKFVGRGKKEALRRLQGKISSNIFLKIKEQII